MQSPELKETIHERVLRLAGYEGVLPRKIEDLLNGREGGHFFPDVYRVLQVMGDIYCRKNDDYGDKRLRGNPEVLDYDVKMLYSDILRKFLRLEEQVWKQGREDGTYDTDKMVETLSDLGVYCVIGIIIAIEKERNDAARIEKVQGPDHGSNVRTGRAPV
jgi:hypothetical protein